MVPGQPNVLPILSLSRHRELHGGQGVSVKKVTEICFKKQPQRTLVARGKLLGRNPWGATGSWLCMKTELREEPYPQQT